MKKALVLGAIAALGSLSFGCAMTDYGVIADGTNKSHGVIGCESSDRFANSQQTVERATLDMFYTDVDPATGDTICPGFGPSITTENVNRQDARDWNRFNGMYAFVTEAQVFGAGGGTWAMGAVKELPNGDRRITTYGSDATGSFSCVGAVVNGRYGGPEGVVAGDGLVNPGNATARIPGFAPDTIAIDRSTGTSSEFCSNIAAVSPARAAGSYSTFLSLLGRGGEGLLHFTPVTRRADNGLAQFLGGGQLTIEHAGVEATMHAQLLEDGRIELFVDALAKDGVTYEANEPVRLVVNPANNFRTIEVHPSQDELVDLYRFLLDADLADRALPLGGTIPELGVTLPEMELMIVGQYLENVINGSTGPIDG